MVKKEQLSISFAGIRIRLILPNPIDCPKELVPFLCTDAEEVDVEYEIVLLTESLQLPKEPHAVASGVRIYPYENHWLRVYGALTTEDGCQVACLLRPNGKNILYYPATRWAYYSEEWHFLHLIGIEAVLLQYDALLLHSSVVMIHDQVVLFSGPSQVGKSTQANLWSNYLGADVLNGDRCVIRKKAGGFYGCGSPWCGTSGIYRKEQGKIKGIFMLRQAKENTIRKLSFEAFAKIFQNCIVNMWDQEFVMKMTDLITELLEQVPVYELACRPDEEAVRLAYDTLFEGGV